MAVYIDKSGRVVVTPAATTPPQQLRPPAWTPPGFIAAPVPPSSGQGLGGGPFWQPW